MNFFNTFRGRLLLILAILLVGTLGVQYYLNLLTQEENNQLRDAQNRALVAGFSLGTYSLTGDDRLRDIVERPDQMFLDEEAKKRIKDIVIVDNNWRISDSINEDYLPTTGENNEVIYKNLKDLTDLPPLIESNRLGEDLTRFPNRKTAENKYFDDEAHALPIETSKGRWYIMILLKNDRSEAAARAAKPLMVTLGVLLLSTLITFWLVWRFTRPIADLSDAARQVADGDLGVRVPSTGRGDEMGRLSERFNEMASELEKAKQLEEQLQQAEKSAVIGRLGSAIAHEIRNPLNYINLTLDHMRAKLAPEDAEKQKVFKKLTSQIKDEVARINRQITDFLNYSRPASVNLGPLDARQPIDDSLRIVEGQAAESNIDISVLERGELPQINGDPEFLRSVFNNLFINAVQAMGNEGGKLTVTLEADGDSVRYEITDTGNGISEENLSNIFEPYFSTKETGTGLGLAIVQKIVDLHNGTIDVESEKDKGTKFTVKLPNVLK